MAVLVIVHMMMTCAAAAFAFCHNEKKYYARGDEYGAVPSRQKSRPAEYEREQKKSDENIVVFDKCGLGADGVGRYERYGTKNQREIRDIGADERAESQHRRTLQSREHRDNHLW